MSKLTKELVRIANEILGPEMPKRPFGKTGFDVGIFSLGGQGSLETQGGEKNCRDIIRRAFDLGINYFDTAPAYGPSQKFYGEVIPDFRDEIFLATKTNERTRDKSLEQLEDSLKTLKTDYIDLWQIHNIGNIDEVNQVTAKDGSLKALIEMREQGVVKHLGITGHSHPEPLLELMSRFDFDSVLCPCNPADAAMGDSFEEMLIPKADSRGMGIVGMKVFAQGRIFHPESVTTPWETVSFALSQPVSTIIVGHDTPEQLEENVAIAKAFHKLSDKQQKEIIGRASDHKERGAFFRKEFGGYDSGKKFKRLMVQRRGRL